MTGVDSTDLKSRFLPDLLAHNQPGMHGFNRWIFQPGMLFQARETWWGERRPRPTPHEGVDLYSFADRHGRVSTLDEHTNIPAAFDGDIVKISRDFLGQSVFLRHDIWSDGRQLWTIYGHLAPMAGLAIGETVAGGQIIACVSPSPGKRTVVPPHVHLTFAWMPAGVHPEPLNWSNLGTDPAITLIDPLPVLDDQAARP
jgi:hypothetical protein